MRMTVSDKKSIKKYKKIEIFQVANGGTIDAQDTEGSTPLQKVSFRRSLINLQMRLYDRRDILRVR